MKWYAFVLSLFMFGCSHVKTTQTPNGQYEGCLSRHLGINSGNVDWFVLFIMVSLFLVGWFSHKHFGK